VACAMRRGLWRVQQLSDYKGVCVCPSIQHLITGHSHMQADSAAPTHSPGGGGSAQPRDAPIERPCRGAPVPAAVPHLPACAPASQLTNGDACAHTNALAARHAATVLPAARHPPLSCPALQRQRDCPARTVLSGPSVLDALLHCVCCCHLCWTLCYTVPVRLRARPAAVQRLHTPQKLPRLPRLPVTL
jgi:hypothetical protein